MKGQRRRTYQNVSGFVGKERIHAAAWQIVFFPMGIVVLILLTAVFLFLFSIRILSRQNVERNLNALKISLNQLESEMDQIDEAFIEYWNESKSYEYFSSARERGPVDEFLGNQKETLDWLNKQISLYNLLEGNFVYYENLNLLLFRGGTDAKMHDYIKERMGSEQEFGQWELVTLEGEQYLVNIKMFESFYGGAWMSVDQIYSSLKIEDDTLLGPTYLIDWKEKATREDVADSGFHNYTVSSEGGKIRMGILIPKGFFASHLPLTVKGILMLLVFSIVLAPVLLVWLQRKMKDFNRMVDEINQLETNLYRTKLREQQIKLKYISRMIQPHFVLNALNIVYSYRETEFSLVKKMVCYLMEYFRYIVYLKTDFVTLTQEMRHIENYLRIQKERYLDAFEYFVEWEAEVSGCMIPPLIIQTFAENCLKYGKRDNGTFFIYVLANIQNGKLRLMVADSGDGFSKEALERLQRFITTRKGDEKLGVGIQNTVERLDLLYEKQVGVDIHNALSGGAVVELFLPLTV